VSQYKTCTKCSQTKAFDAFAKSKLGKNGLRSACKACLSVSAKAWGEKNFKKVAKQNKAWRKANPNYAEAWRGANLEKTAAYSKEYRKNNSEKIAAKNKAWRASCLEKEKAKSKAYYLANRESISARAKAYYQANPEKVNLSSLKRRARKLNNGVFAVTTKELKRLYASPCSYCGAPSEHIDHVIPISRGGTHSVGNLVGACAPCNRGKYDKFITEWNKEAKG
jgi:5-methylcytosine-specific restriction endonuclease McrA